MTDYASLIERLEKADGPDREIDAELAIVGLIDATDARLPSAERDSHYPQSFVPGQYWTGHAWRVADEYTSSLDAALGLVERKLPGWVWKLSTDGDASAPDHKAHATLASEVWADPGAGMGVVTYGHAPTPALAVCLALLRALSEQRA